MFAAFGDVGGYSALFFAAISRARNCLYNPAAREVYFCEICPRSLEPHPCCAKNVRAFWFPPLTRNRSSSSLLHRSMFADLTWDMCTPSERWIQLQSKHTNTPKFFDVHFGFGVVQSKHILLSFFASSLPKRRSRSS